MMWQWQRDLLDAKPKITGGMAFYWSPEKRYYVDANYIAYLRRELLKEQGMSGALWFWGAA